MHGSPPNDLIEQHLWIVEKFAATYQKDAPHADLRAAGALGLCEAAQRFKPGRGFRFSTYAWNWVRGHVLTEVRKSHVVPLPDHTVRAAKREGRVIRRVCSFVNGDSHMCERGRVAEESADHGMRMRALHEAIERLERYEHRHVINRTLAGRSVEQIAFGMSKTEEEVEQLITEAQSELAWLLDG